MSLVQKPLKERASCKTLGNKRKASLRASEALHRRVYRAKRDPESCPAEGGIQAILDSGVCPGHDLGFAAMTE
jgi:hypothetical protein